MGIQIKKTVTVKEKDTGRELILAEEDEAKVDTTVVVTCDNSACVFGEGGKPSTYTWNEEEIKDNPDAIPDDAYRLLTITLFTGKRFVFCSRQCLRDYLRKYQALRSPREMSAEMRQNLSVMQNKKPEEVVIPTEQEVTDILTERINSANRS